MSKIHQVSLPTWERFKSEIIPTLFHDAVFRRGRFVFRGVGDARWELTTFFDRSFDDVSFERRPGVFRQLLQEFRDACTSAGHADAADMNEVDLQALGQHHGLPTRLLDWSESPYVAAYFAFHDWSVNTPGSKEVAIWALDTAVEIWSPDLGVEVVQGRSVTNERIQRQAGRFTYARTPFRTLEEYVGANSYDGVALWKFVLPRDEAVSALAELDVMGINALTLFPDLTGAAATAHMRVALSQKFARLPT